MSVELLKSVYARLTSNDGGAPPDYNDFYDAVGGRIYALEAPPETSFPFCVYNTDQPDVEHFFGNRQRLTSMLTIDVIGTTEAGASALMDVETKLYAHLDLQELACTGFDRLRIRAIQRGSIEFDGGEQYRISSIFEMIATSTGA